jgi:hypothetical protein
MTTDATIKAKPQTATAQKKSVTASVVKDAAPKTSAIKKTAPVAQPSPTKTIANSVPKATAPTIIKQTKPVKPAKPKKVKMVRDSMSIPKDEYAVLETLKLRAIALGLPAKKTEVLRAGIKALSALSDAALLTALKAVPSLKTGRPAKNA